MSKPNPRLKSKREPRQIEGVPAESPAVRAETQEKKSVSISKEKTPEEKQKEYREGIIKTLVATALGIIAGFLAYSVYGTGETKVWYLLLFIVFGITYFAQKYLIFPQLKIDAKEFKLKDWFYVEFIILDFFLVTWTLLLN